MRRARRVWTGAFAAALAGLPLQAAAEPVIKVGPVESERECSWFESYWGWWLVQECQARFPDLRTRLQSAVGETGRLQLSTNTGGGDIPAPDFVLTAQVGGLGAESSRTSAEDYCIASTKVSASLDLRLRDVRSGRVVQAATITKALEAGSDTVAGDDRCEAGRPSRSAYLRLQRELALAAARMVSFHFDPLRVTAASGRRVDLNYGAPLLTLGTMVQTTDERGALVRFRVTGAGPRGATAEAVGSPGRIAPGVLASVIEPEDPAANSRRYERVELP